MKTNIYSLTSGDHNNHVNRGGGSFEREVTGVREDASMQRRTAEAPFFGRGIRTQS